MAFTFDYIRHFGEMLANVAPLLFALLLAITGIAFYIGRQEGWSLADSLYFGFITASTVRYGDLRPT